jgi:hypothetical protein
VLWQDEGDIISLEYCLKHGVCVAVISPVILESTNKAESINNPELSMIIYYLATSTYAGAAEPFVSAYRLQQALISNIKHFNK